MKFGKRLAAEAARCWPEACLDYKAIKRALKKDLASKGGHCTQNSIKASAAATQHIPGVSSVGGLTTVAAVVRLMCI
jgi:hypothetical protein